jgi:hypothetical protein
MEEQTGSNGRGDAARPGDRSNRRRDAVRRTVADPAEVARLFSALPPAAPEAEMSLLGAMIVDPKVIADVIGIVSQPASIPCSPPLPVQVAPLCPVAIAARAVTVSSTELWRRCLLVLSSISTWACAAAATGRSTP